MYLRPEKTSTYRLTIYKILLDQLGSTRVCKGCLVYNRPGAHITCVVLKCRVNESLNRTQTFKGSKVKKETDTNTKRKRVTTRQVRVPGETLLRVVRRTLGPSQWQSTWNTSHHLLQITECEASRSNLKRLVTERSTDRVNMYCFTWNRREFGTTIR